MVKTLGVFGVLQSFRLQLEGHPRQREVPVGPDVVAGLGVEPNRPIS